tara:strand:+ start:478 stop:1443 length:966 start_codon:yes stop_codon:yes gene_type:complete
MKKIVIGSPSYRFTGGPTLAHQLCAELSNQGFEASMYYYNVKDKKKVMHPDYAYFNNNYNTVLQDDENTIFIAPETHPDMLRSIKKGIKVIWWMSVDNYFDKYLTSRRNRILNIGGLLKFNIDRKDTFHFAQSQYAIEFLENRGIDKKKIFYVSDYLNDIFIENSSKHMSEKKNDVILYSPKRGLEFTKLIIKKMPEVEWIPLQNLTQQEMISLMQSSKLYVDFGNHPGKDRIPREAVINGCCIITGSQGSAKNEIDINISREFKFEEIDSEIDEIVNKIQNILANYNTNYELLKNYRKKITLEHKKFSEDVAMAFKLLNN